MLLQSNSVTLGKGEEENLVVNLFIYSFVSSHEGFLFNFSNILIKILWICEGYMWNVQSTVHQPSFEFAIFILIY